MQMSDAPAHGLGREMRMEIRREGVRVRVRIGVRVRVRVGERGRERRRGGGRSTCESRDHMREIEHTGEHMQCR